MKYHSFSDRKSGSGSTIIDNVSSFLRISNENLIDIFLKIDLENKGVITFLEFKNALKKLRLGISNKELNELLFYCNVDNFGFVN